MLFNIMSNYSHYNTSQNLLSNSHTDTCDVVTGQVFVTMADTEDEMSIFISSAILRLTVAAHQLHLDLTLAVTLHDWKK